MYGEEADALAAFCAREFSCTVLSVEPLASGLGTRRFYRLRLSGTPASLVARVDAPEDPRGRPQGAAPEPELGAIRDLLEQHGLPVPACLAVQPGVVFLEDAGDLHLADAAKRMPRARAEALLQTALDELPRLQAIEDPGDVPAFRRRLDARVFRYKAQLFARESLPLALGRAPGAEECAVLERGFRFIAELAQAAPQRLAHRDFQSRNLLVQPCAQGGALRLVWIDLQGAWLAPPEYDAACLLRDSYIDWGARCIDKSLAALRPRLPDAPPADVFALRFEALALARKCKDHARFVAYAKRPGAEGLRDYLPLTVRHLHASAQRMEQRAAAPELEGLLELVQALPVSPP